MPSRSCLLPLLLAAILAACGGSAAPGSNALRTVGPPATATGVMAIVKGDNIYLMHADAPGSSDEQLTHETNSNFANNPSFSPDGSLIAYTHHIAPQGDNWGGAELHLMRSDGSDDKTLVPAKAKGERAENPAWTPDAKSIYFAHDIPLIDQSNRYTGDTLTIDKIDAGGGQPQAIVQGAVFPTISRAGAFAWVIYNVNDSSFKLMVGNLDGSGGKQLLSDRDFQGVYWPELSPDGKTIVFAGDGRTDSKVNAVAGLIAGALNPLIPGAAQAHGLPWDVWAINIDGTGFKKLATISSDEMAFAWSPDGSEIVFSNLSSTYLMRADGSGLNRLLQRGDPGGIDWKAS